MTGRSPRSGCPPPAGSALPTLHRAALPAPRGGSLLLLHHLHHLVVLMPGLSHWHQQLVDEMAFPHAVNAIDAVEALLQPGGAGLLGTDDEEDLHDAWKRRCHPALN